MKLSTIKYISVVELWCICIQEVFSSGFSKARACGGLDLRGLGVIEAIGSSRVQLIWLLCAWAWLTGQMVGEVMELAGGEMGSFSVTSLRVFLYETPLDPPF